MAWLGSRWVGIRGIPYSAGFIAALKAALPLRAWDPTTKTWWFPEGAADFVSELMETYGIAHTPWLRVETGPVNGRPAGTPYSVLGCSPSADNDVVRAAYRTLAKKHHPDRGGDPEVMKLVNAAWTQIQRERKL